MLETVLSILASTGLVSWLGGKLFGFVRKRTSNKVTIALDTAVQLARQLLLSGAGKTPEQMIGAFKGIFAIQLARAGIYEKDRGPYQGLIDLAIATLVREWYETSASKSPPPIAGKVI